MSFLDIFVDPLTFVINRTTTRKDQHSCFVNQNYVYDFLINKLGNKEVATMHKNGNILYEIVMTVKGLLDLKIVISVLNCKDRTFSGRLDLDKAV